MESDTFAGASVSSKASNIQHGTSNAFFKNARLQQLQVNIGHGSDI